MSTAVAVEAATDVAELEPQTTDYSADALTFWLPVAIPGNKGLVPGAMQQASSGVLEQLRAAVNDGDVEEVTSGAPQIKLEVIDPKRKLLNSGVFNYSVGVTIDGIDWHLVHVDYTDTARSLTLTFEHHVVTEMRQDTKPLKVSRGAMTRAEFIYRKLVKPIPTNVRFVCPQLSVKQRLSAPTKAQQATPKRGGSKGFDKGARVKIGSGFATPEQLRTASIALEEAAKLNATPLATLGLICLGLGESGLKDIMQGNFVSVERWKQTHAAGTNGYGGPFQGQVAMHPSNWFGPMSSEQRTREQAKSALQGGRGYQQGGFMTLARKYPGMTPGEMCWRVGGDRSNFSSDGAATAHYEKWRSDAKGIIDAYKGGGGSFGGGGSYWKQYEFTRGQPGVTNEDSWAAAIRLANEVRWRFFIVGDRTVYFVTDDDLLKAPPQYAISASSPGFVDVTFDVEVGGRYVVRHGFKTLRPSEATLTVDAKRWAARPGALIVLAADGPDGFGNGGGTWIVDSTTRSLFSPRMQIHLRRPQSKLPEPRSELVQRSKSKTTPTSANNPSRSNTTPARQGSGPWGMLVDGLTFAGFDAGIDFTGHGTIYAPCDLLITRIVPSKADPSSGWMGGVAGQDHVVVGKILSNDPPAGFDYLYFAEAVVPDPGYRVGDTVKAGSVIATLNSSYPGTEVGFARDGHGNPWGKSSDGRVNNGPYGRKLGAWLQQIKRRTRHSTTRPHTTTLPGHGGKHVPSP